MRGELAASAARPWQAQRVMVLRLVSSSDAAFMERMMLLAGFPPDRELPADAREMPHVRRFLDGWGRPGDVGAVALDEAQRPLGAAWARVLDEPLLRDDHGAAVAELAIAVEKRARGRGVGSTLVDALAEAAAAAGHRELSLNVSPRNAAHRLYLRCGFEPVGEGAHGVVMRRRLT
jgi:GNAT superfamily N-acetyltransferase